MEQLRKSVYEDKQIYIEKLAKIVNSANKAYCEVNGDYSQKNWEQAEPWQKESIVKAIKFRLLNPNAKEDSQHNLWMQGKINNGWVYGKVKNADKKTHPYIVPFNDLPKYEQYKDRLVCAIIDVFGESIRNDEYLKFQML